MRDRWLKFRDVTVLALAVLAGRSLAQTPGETSAVARPPPPKVRPLPGKLTMHGRVLLQVPEVSAPSISPEALQAYMKARSPALLGCYEKRLKSDPALKGKVVVRFTIAPTGQATDADIEENTMDSEPLAACLKEVVRGWTTPFAPAVAVEVAAPFVFSPLVE